MNGPVWQHVYEKSRESLFLHSVVKRCMLFRLRSWSPAFLFFASSLSSFLSRQHACCNSPTVVLHGMLPYTIMLPKSWAIVLRFYDLSRSLSKFAGIGCTVICVVQMNNCISTSSWKRCSKTRKWQWQSREKWASGTSSVLALLPFPQCFTCKGTVISDKCPYYLDLAFLPKFLFTTNL